MRVLFLTHRLPYAPNRGDRIRAYHMLQQIARRAEVDLVSLTHDAEEDSHAADLGRVVGRLVTARVPRARNLARGLLALPTSRPMTHVLLDAPGIRPALARLMAARTPDVVLAYCSSMARFALEEPLRSLPAVIDLVDVDSAKWHELAGVTSPPRRWIYRRERRHLARFEIAAASQARAMVVVNEREAASLRRLAPGVAVHVVPNGIDLGGFRPARPAAESATVVFCGVMNYSPNEQGAIWLARSVWPIVRSRRPDARLSLVGADPAPAVRALASRDPSIVVTGTVPDVRQFLHTAAVAAAPLATARGIQNKVLEAIAAGLPAIVRSAVFEGLPPEAGPACTVADSPESFASAILDRLALPPAARRAVAQQADLTSIDWPRRLAPLLEILERAARRGN